MNFNLQVEGKPLEWYNEFMAILKELELPENSLTSIEGRLRILSKKLIKPIDITCPSCGSQVNRNQLINKAIFICNTCHFTFQENQV